MAVVGGWSSEQAQYLCLEHDLQSKTKQRIGGPSLGIYLLDSRKEGTCNESLVGMYHECFSDSLMDFRWDLEENQ